MGNFCALFFTVKQKAKARPLSKKEEISPCTKLAKESKRQRRQRRNTFVHV